MSEPVPLTDEELAGIESEWSRLTAKGLMPAANAGPRLIATLRASRAEVERLRAENHELRALATRFAPVATAIILGEAR